MTKREKQLVEALRKMISLAELSAVFDHEIDDECKAAREILKQYDTKEKKHEV